MNFRWRQSITLAGKSSLRAVERFCQSAIPVVASSKFLFGRHRSSESGSESSFVCVQPQAARHQWAFPPDSISTGAAQ